MARFPSIDDDGAFEAPEVQDHIKNLVTAEDLGITVDTSVGTRVYVGDTMIHGDTGWRILAQWDDDGNVTYGELPNNLEPLDGPSGGAGGIQIRRINSEVFFQIHSAITTGLVGLTSTHVPNGFRASSVNEQYVRYSAGSDTFNTAAIRTFGMRFGSSGETYDNRYGMSIRWIVDTAWPTTEPGIPR